MLGSVLIIIMEHPGISGKDIANRFSPGLQPAHTQDLLDILVILKCVTKQVLKLSYKSTFNSKPIDYLLCKYV